MQLIFSSCFEFEASLIVSYLFFEEGICDSLRNVPHMLLFEHLSLNGGTVWGHYRILVHVTLLEEVCQLGLDLQFDLYIMNVDRKKISLFSNQVAL